MSAGSVVMAAPSCGWTESAGPSNSLIPSRVSVMSCSPQWRCEQLSRPVERLVLCSDRPSLAIVADVADCREFSAAAARGPAHEQRGRRALGGRGSVQFVRTGSAVPRSCRDAWAVSPRVMRSSSIMSS